MLYTKLKNTAALVVSLQNYNASNISSISQFAQIPKNRFLWRRSRQLLEALCFRLSIRPFVHACMCECVRLSVRWIRYFINRFGNFPKFTTLVRLRPRWTYYQLHLTMVAHYKNQDILLDFEVKRSKVKVMARPNTVTKTERHIRRRVLCSFDYILVIFRWNSFSESANTFVSLFHSKLKA